MRKSEKRVRSESDLRGLQTLVCGGGPSGLRAVDFCSYRTISAPIRRRGIVSPSPRKPLKKTGPPETFCPECGSIKIVREYMVTFQALPIDESRF